MSFAELNERLAQARQALGQGDDAGALENLLHGWRLYRAPQLADLIERVSSRILDRWAPPAPVLEALAYRGAHQGSLYHTRVGAEFEQLWLSSAVEQAPSQLGWLAKTMGAFCLRVDGLMERLRLLERWPDDPRLSSALAARLIDLRPRAADARPFWAKVLSIVVRIGDPRAMEPLLGLKDMGDASIAPTLRGWLFSAASDAAAEIRTASLQSFDALQLASIERLLGAPEAAILLERIRRAPFDDALKQIYADALLLRDDPQGEFIALQQAQPKGEAALARMWTLFKQHQSSWLGPLAPVVVKASGGEGSIARIQQTWAYPGARERWAALFEGGFLSRCCVRPTQAAQLQSVLGDPRFATVVEYIGPLQLALHPIMRSLTHLHIDGLGLSTLSALPPSIGRPIQRLRLISEWLTDVDAPTVKPRAMRMLIDALQRFDAVTGLELWLWDEGQRSVALRPELFAPLLTSSPGARLSAFGITCRMETLDAWIESTLR